ncbi:MAG: serine protease [Bacteroidales bacterium]
MKTKLIFLFLILSVLSCYSQSKISNDYPIDYNKCNKEVKGQIWTLENILLENEYTAIQTSIRITNNKAGSFIFPKNISIAATGVNLRPKFLAIGEQEWELGTPYGYSKGNKGNWVVCTLFFERIPAGISRINYTEPAFIQWNNIPLPNNPNTTHTNWNEVKLKEKWSNETTPIEGIYTFIGTDNMEWWGDAKHTLGVVKSNNLYQIIYLNGSNEYIWKEGDLKAEFTPTATVGLYKITNWLMENKMPNSNFYLTFSNGSMSIYENDNEITADFIKLYPQNESFEYLTQTSTTESVENNDLVNSGSGVIISTNGIIATNYHLIKDATNINVTIKEEGKISTYSAKILCSDIANDLALLSIKDKEFKAFTPIPYTLSTNINEVGTQIFSMSYPLTNYMGSEIKVTDGIINSKSGYQNDVALYQISAPIQPGSSGAPLFNKRGELIGITNSGIMSANNVGYAIKSMFLSNLIESAPINIENPSNNTLNGMEFTEQIKELTSVVVYISVQ